MRSSIVAVISLFSASFFTLPTYAQIRKEPVHFAKGATSATVKGSLQGDDTVDYILGAKAGQKMSVVMKPTNLSTYFNVMPAGEETAIFVGSSGGNQFEGKLPKSGDYAVRVYLMRNAARRGAKTSYTITFKILPE